MHNKKIFRQVSLDRLSSAEDLNQLIKITSKKAWMILLGFGISIFMIVIWGIYGDIPTKVEGTGIIVNKGGIYTIHSNISGEISKLFVKKNDIVQKGQLILKVKNQNLLNKVELSQKQFEYLNKEYQEKIKDAKISFKRNLKVLKNQKKEFSYTVSLLEKNIKNLISKQNILKKLYKEGLARKELLISNDEKLNKIKINLFVAKNKYNSIDNQIKILKDDFKVKNDDIKTKIYLLKKNLKDLKSKEKILTSIYSSYAGKVIELDVKKGELLFNNKKLLTIDSIKHEDVLYAVVFVPAVKGKQIEIGMDANIAPSYVKREEFGYIKGKVVYVSEFPMSFAGMKNIIDNNDLINSFIKDGPPLAVYVKLEKDNTTISGLRWSSIKGPPIKITGGTICKGRTVVRHQAPMSLVIPEIKKILLYSNPKKQDNDSK